MKPEQKMDKQKAQQMFELANRLINLDASTLSEQQLQQRNDMIFKLKEEIKMLDEASLAQMRDFFKTTDPKVRSVSPTAKYVANTNPNAQANMQKRFRSQAEYEEWLEKNGLKQISGVKKEGMAEEFNGEYDDEAGMVQSNLRTMARAVNGLLDTIEDNDNLPEWAQEKIAKAEMMTTSVWDYLLSQKEQGMDPKVTEGAPPRVDSLVTDALKIMRGSDYQVDAVKAIKTVLGDREYNSRRGFYSFYVKQLMDMHGQEGIAETKKPSPKLTPVTMKKTDPVSEEINNEAYERLQKVFAFKNYES